MKKKIEIMNSFGYNSLEDFYKDIERAKTELNNYKGRLLALVVRYGYNSISHFLEDWNKLETPDFVNTKLNGITIRYGHNDGFSFKECWCNETSTPSIPTQPTPPPPPKDFEQLTADQFVSLSGHSRFSDGPNGTIISDTNFKQWTMTSTGVGPTQLANACILKDNVDTYGGLVCEFTDEYSCAVGNKHTGDANRMYLYGIFGMNLSVIKSDINNNTFLLNPTPNNTIKPQAGDLIYIRYTKVGNRFRMNISILRNNYTLAAGNLMYTFQVAQEPLLGISAGWQGGGGTNIVAKKVMGIRHGVDLIKESLNNNDVNRIKEEYYKIFS